VSKDELQKSFSTLSDLQGWAMDGGRGVIRIPEKVSGVLKVLDRQAIIINFIAAVQAAG
jgi:hypothetical protein